MLRVLLIIHHRLDPDLGAPGATLLLGAALQALGCQVECVGFDEVLPKISEHGVGSAVRFPWRVARYLAQNAHRFDVIDGSTGDTWVWAARGRPGGRRPHVLITRSHGIEHLMDRQLRAAAREIGPKLSWKYPIYHGGLRLWEVKRSLTAADHCVLLNGGDRDFVRDVLGVPGERLSVIPVGIADYFFGIEPFATVPPGSEAAPAPLRLVFVGSWIARKGTATLAAALARLLEARESGGAGSSGRPPFRLTLLGTGVGSNAVLAELPPSVRAQVDTITPRFKNTDLPGLLAGHDVLLFPSLFEGFSRALIEAMACGLTPIATPVGGAPSVIVPGQNGFLVPVSDPAALAGAIQRLNDDRTVLAAMRRAAWQSAQQYRWETVARQTLSLYESVLAGRPQQ